MKRFFCVLICLCLLAACSSPKNDESGIALPEPPAEESKLAGPLTVYFIPQIMRSFRGRLDDIYKEPQSLYLEQLNRMIRDNGFSIRFEPILPEGWANTAAEYFDASYSRFQSLAETREDVALATSLDQMPDLVTTDIFVTEPVDIDTLADRFESPDLTETWEAEAPRWRALFDNADIDIDRAIPTAVGVEESDYPAVLIPDGILSAYGKKIRTLSEYEAFMAWAKKEYPNKTPALFVTGYNSLYARSHELITLLAPEYGYVSIDQLIGAQTGFVAPIESSGENLDWLPFERAPFISDAMKRLGGWLDGKLVEIQFKNAFTRDWTAYCSVLVSASYYQPDRLRYQLLYDGEKLWGVSGYTMQVLYQDKLPDVRQNGGAVLRGCALMGKNTKEAYAGELMRFMEWLHGDEEHYRLIHWGVEGDDYSIVDGKRELLNKEYDYSQLSALFYLEDMRFYLPRDDMPHNMGEELSALSYVPWPAGDALRADPNKLKEQSERLISANQDYKNAVTQRVTAIKTFFGGASTTLSALNVQEKIAPFAQAQQKNANALIQYLSDLWSAVTG